MSISVVRSLPEDEWRNFVERHDAGNVFHTPEMFQVFSRTKGYRPDLWAATEDGHTLALLMPVQVTLMNGLLRYFTTRSVAYGSVLCVPDRGGQKALDRLLEDYTREVARAALFTQLRNLSNLELLQPILGNHGFIYEDYLNYLIDLNRPPDEVFRNVGRRTRKNIRRGLRRGEVVIAEVQDRDELPVCYELLRQTYRVAQVPLADYSLFESAFDLLYPKGMVRFTVARVAQTAVATSVDLLYKGVVYGWYGGVDRAYGSYVPNELLMWHLLQWGAESGYRVYDFGGAGKPDEEYGVRDFKAKFGGQLVSFGRFTCNHAPNRLKLSKLGYRLCQCML